MLFYIHLLTGGGIYWFISFAWFVGFYLLFNFFGISGVNGVSLINPFSNTGTEIQCNSYYYDYTKAFCIIWQKIPILKGILTLTAKAILYFLFYQFLRGVRSTIKN